MAIVAYPGTPGTVIYGGIPIPTGGTTLTTITLANTSGSTQAAGFVSPMFGLPLKQGDVPAGQYPAFELADGTPCDPTIYATTSWPDGSMKWCGVFLRVPTTVAGSGTLAITVKNGGSAPGSSARAVSDLTAADLKVELTGVTNLTGTWTASLNDAITNGTAVQIADGPAGAIWRVLGDFKQSGAAHGQLVCWHYVAALQNASGGLLGIRYLGRVAQPWADVTTPTPTRRVVNAVLKVGASTLRTLQGHDTTETVGANIGMPHYTSFFTAGADAKWDFVQGGGSASSDCTVRVQHDKTYFVKSRLVPPYDMTVPATSSPNFDYRPYGAGPMQRNVGGTGERDDIGIMTAWSVRHLMTQSAVDEKVIRVVGLCSGGWRQVSRKQSTKQIIPCVDPSPSYTGLGTIENSWRIRPGNMSGAVAPVDDSSLWQSEFEPSHRPSATYYVYLVTGEPQYLDMLVEQANGLLLSAVPGSSSPNTAAVITQSTLWANSDYGGRTAVVGGTTYKGGGFWFIDGLLRIPAWGTRDICHAAAIYPDVCPSGTQKRKYFREVVEATYAAANAYNNARPQSWRDSGLFAFDPREATEVPWCHGFASYSLCHQTQILPSTAGTEFRQHMGRYWSSAKAIMDIGCIMSYLGSQYDENGVRFESMSDMLFVVGTTLNFSAATSRATIAGSPSSWAPTNGDKFSFSSYQDADKPFPAAVNSKIFYAVNVSGNSFQLAATPGGTPITVPADVSITGFFAQLANFAPNISFENVVGPNAYVSIIYGCIRMHEACGDTFINAARVAADAKVASAGISFVGSPKNAMSNSYPV